MAWSFLFVLGAAIGALARHAWGDAMRIKAEGLLKREEKHWAEEIKRLRTQVANLIGSDKPTLCDVSHAGQNARVGQQAERLPKAA